jgi:flagellar biosynthetic protein FlhB
MSEDRTQAPSKRRRQLAREQGQVAHSPELTAAAGWLVALLALGIWGGDLTQAMVGLVRDPFIQSPRGWLGAPELIALLRGRVLSLAVPLGLIIGSFSVGALAAHQLQVRGLWAVGRVAPDPSRLWTLGRGGGLASGVERLAWSVIKTLILVGVSSRLIHARWDDIRQLSELEGPALASAAGSVVMQPARVVGMVMLLLGLADYALRYVRFESVLRTTPDEHREDQRAMEGDLSLRARRQRLARTWRGDDPAVLDGASLLLAGDAGLTLVLSGGPPPRRVTVRTVAQGTAGLRLRRSTAAQRLPQVESPELARHLSQHAVSGSLVPLVLPSELMSELAMSWSTK